MHELGLCFINCAISTAGFCVDTTTGRLRRSQDPIATLREGAKNAEIEIYKEVIEMDRREEDENYQPVK